MNDTILINFLYYLSGRFWLASIYHVDTALENTSPTSFQEPAITVWVDQIKRRMGSVATVPLVFLLSFTVNQACVQQTQSIP